MRQRRLYFYFMNLIIQSERIYCQVAGAAVRQFAAQCYGPRPQCCNSRFRHYSPQRSVMARGPSAAIRGPGITARSAVLRATAPVLQFAVPALQPAAQCYGPQSKPGVDCDIYENKSNEKQNMSGRSQKLYMGDGRNKHPGDSGNMCSRKVRDTG